MKELLFIFVHAQGKPCRHRFIRKSLHEKYKKPVSAAPLQPRQAFIQFKLEYFCRPRFAVPSIRNHVAVEFWFV